MATTVDDRIGLVIDDRYRLVALIGDGGSARVYLADAVRLRRPVAVKILRAGLVDDPRFLYQFATEGEVIASLHHPNIVVIHDSGETEDGPYLVTEYLAGGSLKAMLDHGHRLTPPQAVRVGAQAAAGLGAAHRAGLVHRDVKPGNLLFDAEGNVKIADFGVARALSGAARTEPDAFAPATARYTAPDRLSSGVADPRSDVYSLCLTLVEAVTGEVPFAGPDLMATFDLRRAQPVPIPSEFGPARAILSRAGSPDPAERPGAAELADVLGRAEALATRIDPLPLVGASIGASIGNGGEVGGDVANPTTVHAVPQPPATAHKRDTGPRRLHPADRRRRRNRSRRRRWTSRALGLVVLAAMAAVAAVAVSTVEEPGEPTATLQQFVGSDIDDVRSSADAAGWVLGEREVRSDGAALGTVVAQRPQAGTELREGSTVTVDVVMGPYLVLAPRLVGVEEAAAVARLQARGFQVAERTEAFHEVVPAGAVAEARIDGQVDPGLTLHEPGTAVSLVVSQGPEPRPVPDLAGMDAEQARTALAGVQLTLGSVTEEFSETVDAGLVTAQSVPAGDPAPRDSAVDVAISKGPDRRSVPAMEGLTIDQATEALEAVGLVRGGVEGSGLVVRFSEPAAGALLPPGSEVVLFAPG